MNNRLSAIVLAAGFSSRMGKFKPLLSIGGKSVIERTVSVFQDNGIQDIIVVTGHRASEISAAIQHLNIRIVKNFDYEQGMFSSVKAGVINLNVPETSAFFIIPADICLVRPYTVRLLISAFDHHPGRILHPCFNSVRGHPPLIPSQLISVILEKDPDGGLKSVLKKYDHVAVDITVPDRHILSGMNQLEDYENTLLRFSRHDIPTTAECEIILTDIVRIPADIAAHSRKVAQTALWMVSALKRIGFLLNPDLINAAALLHDIGKGHKNHAYAGASILLEMGFPRVAHIVAGHMDFEIKPGRPIDETAVVFLADKLTLENHTVTLEQRFEAILNRIGNDPDSRAVILKRRNTAVLLKQEVERLLGFPIELL